VRSAVDRCTPLSRRAVARAARWARRQPDEVLQAAVRRARTLKPARHWPGRARLRGHAAYVELGDRAVDALVAADPPPRWVTEALGPLPERDDDAADWWERAFRLAIRRAVAGVER
jgi:hypothetical protein